ncbi:MAG: hypothetical protein ACRD3T_19515 [Terriglobia bacterium]
MIMGRSPCLVIIDIINILGVALGKTENHPPVSPDGHGPKAFSSGLERMQPETRHVHIGHGAGRVEPRENIPKFNDVFSRHPARFVVFVKAS